MGFKLQFMLEAIQNNNPQWVANIDAPQDETFHTLLGGPPSKGNEHIKPIMQPKGLPPSYSEDVFREIHSREGSDAVGRNLVVSYLSQEEFSIVYQGWKDIKERASRLIGVEITMSIFHQFAIRDWGEARLIYCIFE